MDILLCIVWPLVCGIANRIRGGWLASYIKGFFPWWSTTPARLFVSFIITLPVIIKHTKYEAALFWLLLFIGFIFRWSPWNIMDHPDRDIPTLTFRGLLLTFPAGIYLDMGIFAYCGLSMGLIYYIARKLNLYHRDCNGYVWVSSDWGELFFGTILGVGICLSCI